MVMIRIHSFAFWRRKAAIRIKITSMGDLI